MKYEILLPLLAPAYILYLISYILYLIFPAAPQRVVPGRVELPTSTLSVWRSNQLSYRTSNGR